MKLSFGNITEVIRSVRRLWPHLRGGRSLVAAVMLASLAGAVLEGAGIGLMLPLFNIVLGGGSPAPMRPITKLHEFFPNHGPAFYVGIFCALVFTAIAAKNLMMYLSQILGARLRARISLNLRNSLFRHLHRADLLLFESRQAGEISNVFLQETSRTLGMVDLGLLLTQRFIMGLFYVLFLVFISWQLMIFTVVTGLAIGAMVGFIHRRLARSGVEITEASNKLSGMVMESFAGIRVVRTTNSQDREIERFEELNRRQTAIEEKMGRSGALLLPITETVSVAAAMLMIGGAYIFLVKPGVMLPSYQMVFGFIVVRMLPLIGQLHSLQGHVFYLAAGAKEVEKWFELPLHPRRPFGEVVFETVRQEIRFDRVGFTFPIGTRALAEISFAIPAGKTVALVGSSGSGKSTIASLLLRFRAITEGKIIVDGRDYWEYTAESWHTALGVVEQEAFLFHDTMARNIGYGFPRVTEEQIRAAVRMAHLEDVVNALPSGLETIVGERGTMLSGGQRQRLAIARALVRDPRILILDEATSSLDTLSERQVQAALEDAVQGRTVLVIAHRLSTIRNADRIVVLDQGRVVEQGGWEELVAAGGAFAKLVRMNALTA